MAFILLYHNESIKLLTIATTNNVIHDRAADTTERRIPAATTKYSNQPISTRYISTISE